MLAVTISSVFLGGGGGGGGGLASPKGALSRSENS